MTNDQNGKKKRVLVVEDEKLMNWSITESLSRWGYEALGVFNGQDALARVEGQHFDVIFLDYQLPDLDGLQVARRVRHVLPDVTIVLLTAYQLAELDVGQGLIDAYFNKPVDMRELHKTMQRIAGAPSTSGD